MLDNFLNFVRIVKIIEFIVNFYICVIYRRASHAGPSAPLCFAQTKGSMEYLHELSK